MIDHGGRGHGPDVFYRGAIAKALADDMREHGGLLVEGDLAGYRPRVHEDGLRGTYRDLDVIGVPGPTGARHRRRGRRRAARWRGSVHACRGGRDRRVSETAIASCQIRPTAYQAGRQWCARWCRSDQLRAG